MTTPFDTDIDPAPACCAGITTRRALVSLVRCLALAAGHDPRSFDVTELPTDELIAAAERLTAPQTLKRAA